MNYFGAAFRGKKVVVTGHTGFKGAWLSEWLLALGADVTGFSLAPNTTPSLFNQLGLSKRMTHVIGDIQDARAVRKTLIKAKPDYVFHLAAQPLVRDSYDRPLETFNVNVIGTAHVLETLKDFKKPCAGVFITTDKCYENREWLHGYREEDPLGGHDPYSASKAAAEIVIHSYRRSFFENHPVRLASVRAGNVIGGGDWAKDRIIPDCIRALQKQETIFVRNKVATRPWQHVLEPLGGYLWLGAVLGNPKWSKFNPALLTSAFNFGPARESNRSVADLVTEVLSHWSGRWEDKSDPKAVHEAKLLHLSTDKAHTLLDWKPVWNFAETIQQTIGWYRDLQRKKPEQIRAYTQQQINLYCEQASTARLAWTQAPK
jgi:CDP-glucose 4,6-dehydratase